MSTLTFTFTIGKHWIGLSTIAFRKRDENGLAHRHPSIHREYRVGLTFTSMQQMHNDLCPPPHHLTTPFSHVTLLLLRPTMAYRGRNFSPSIFAVFRRISRYITPAECIQNAVRPCKYPISILSPSISVTWIKFSIRFPDIEKQNAVTNEIDYRALSFFPLRANSLSLIPRQLSNNSSKESSLLCKEFCGKI